jgi:5-hydroxyisourate hydrolase-like protein (transthyretin family)
MDSNARFKSAIGFIDLLFNILLGFAFLFIVAFLLIKPEAKKKDFDRRAEFIVILEWNHDAPDDLDLYVQDPLENRVSFRHSTVNFMHLDKDDLGSMNDTITNADGTVSTVRINREVVTIRGIIEGEYIINGHYYSERSYKQIAKKYKELTVKVELHKVNPYSILWVGEKKFTHRGQEETFVRFRLDKSGNILPPFTFEKKKFVTPLMSTGNYHLSPVAGQDQNNDDAE